MEFNNIADLQRLSLLIINPEFQGLATGLNPPERIVVQMHFYEHIRVS